MSTQIQVHRKMCEIFANEKEMTRGEDKTDGCFVGCEAGGGGYRVRGLMSTLSKHGGGMGIRTIRSCHRNTHFAQCMTYNTPCTVYRCHKIHFAQCMIEYTYDTSPKRPP